MTEQKDERVVYVNGKPSLTASIARLLNKLNKGGLEYGREKFKK